MKRTLLWICLGMLCAAPAGAVGITLHLDPALSSLDPEFAAAQPLSGQLRFEVGALPVTGNTSFDASAIDVSSGDGTTISLDPNVASPGLGVINDAGSFLIPTLFLQLDDGGITTQTVVDVTGSVVFGRNGDTIKSLSTSFDVDSGGPAGIVSVTIVAVPEPSTLLLAAGGLLLLARRARREAGAER
jgi:hypothetical protein